MNNNWVDNLQTQLEQNESGCCHGKYSFVSCDIFSMIPVAGQFRRLVSLNTRSRASSSNNIHVQMVVEGNGGVNAYSRDLASYREVAEQVVVWMDNGQCRECGQWLEEPEHRCDWPFLADEVCSICQNPCKGVTRLDCGHPFHRTCLNSAIGACPLCRFPLSGKLLQMLRTERGNWDPDSDDDSSEDGDDEEENNAMNA